MKIEIELPFDAVESVVIKELSWHLKYTKQKHSIPMFSYDPKEEKQRVKELQDAFKRVLAYYGVKK